MRESLAHNESIPRHAVRQTQPNRVRKRFGSRKISALEAAFVLGSLPESTPAVPLRRLRGAGYWTTRMELVTAIRLWNAQRHLWTLPFAGAALLAATTLLPAQDAAGPALPAARIESERATPEPTPIRTASNSTATAVMPPERLTEPGSTALAPIQPTFVELTDDHFRSLLGEQDLAGWSIHEGRPGTWSRLGDVITAKGIGAGWLLSDISYSDFIMRFDYRLSQAANSGVAVRCSSEGNPTYTGMEVQLIDDSAPKYADLRPTQYTGSLYYRVAPETRAQLAPIGEWNNCEIRCLGAYLEILINGQSVNRIALRGDRASNPLEQQDVVPTAYSLSSWNLDERPPIGRIALQSHPTGVEFRNLRIVDLAKELPSGLKIVELVAGKSDADPVAATDTVRINYIGQFTNGKIFADTREHGGAVSVALGDVIEGWSEGIVGMKPGERRRLIVPPVLAYGDEGVENLIPPRATLVFEVELQEVER